MPILNPEACERGRREPCIWCGATGRCVCIHVLSKGFGGGMRLETELTLCGMCHPCHMAHHDDGKPSRDEIADRVAERHGLTLDQWWEIVWRLRREDHR